ncbi:MAG: DoxX family protein [Candidatus Omnitrophota bacterium]
MFCKEFCNSEKICDIGILILRIGIGLMFIYHGLPKIMGGLNMWQGLGKTMSLFGINFIPTFWGFMASFAEFFGGIFIVLGIFFRPACFLLLINMIVASLMHLLKGDGLLVASHAIEMSIVFLSLIFIGSGKFSLCNKR